MRLAEVNVRLHATVPGSAVLISATAAANRPCGSCDSLARLPSNARDRRSTSPISGAGPKLRRLRLTVRHAVYFDLGKDGETRTRPSWTSQSEISDFGAP